MLVPRLAALGGRSTAWAGTQTCRPNLFPLTLFQRREKHEKTDAEVSQGVSKATAGERKRHVVEQAGREAPDTRGAWSW